MPKTIEPTELHRALIADEAILIDIREADEYAREHIPGSRLVPLSGLDAADFPEAGDRMMVLHCASGSRTAIAAARILERGFREVYQLEGGLEGWKAAGFETRINRKMPIPIQRQVQMTAGALVLLGLLLAWLVSPWFALLSAFVGGGLVFAGLSGTCTMARLLAQLPYNRRALADR